MKMADLYYIYLVTFESIACINDIVKTQLCTIWGKLMYNNATKFRNNVNCVNFEDINVKYYVNRLR